MLIFTLLAARAPSTAETPAWLSLSLTNFLRRRSSCSHFEKSFSEYHFELQPRMTPSRKPTGCVFFPIFFFSCLLCTPSGLYAFGSIWLRERRRRPSRVKCAR